LRVRVKLFGIFCDFLPPKAEGSGFWLDFQGAARLKDIFSRLKIPEDLARSVIHNGRVGEEYQVLQEGDTVAIFSPITGG
jgi:molybdopterin converting factor small subunit